MRTPGFWYEAEPRGATRWLRPIGALYASASALRIARAKPVDPGIPVICVGNLVAGGAGKTPVAIDFLWRLRSAGIDAHGLTRGYGGRERGPVEVKPEGEDAARVGDEAILLSHAAPTWVARDRLAGARAAAARGAKALVLDDGHQNPALRKRLSVVVVDGAVGFGNGATIPAGPLREPIARGLARAQAIVLVGEDRTGAARHFGRLPVLRARLVPTEAAQDLAGRAVFAMAGIGRPEKFFETLYGLGARVVARKPFADHHRYAAAELDQVLADAERQNAVPVTTMKDWVRLPEAYRDRFGVVQVALDWEDEEAVGRLLLRAVGR